MKIGLTQVPIVQVDYINFLMKVDRVMLNINLPRILVIFNSLKEWLLKRRGKKGNENSRNW